MDESIKWEPSLTGSDLLVETAKFHDLTLNIHYDDSGVGDPRDADNLTEMVCSHPRYTLGDRTPDETEEEALNRGGWPLLTRYLRMCKGALIVEPLGLYDHSGISMYVGTVRDPWDSGQVGFAYVTKDRFKELCGDTDPNALEERERYPGRKITQTFLEWAVEGEVEEYSSFIEGQVYGYEVVDANDEIVDSCWGFVGDMKYVKEEAEASAKAEYRSRFPVPATRERVGV